MKTFGQDNLPRLEIRMPLTQIPKFGGAEGQRGATAQTSFCIGQVNRAVNLILIKMK